jgi:A/G-specific adenine glycosylase
VTRLAAALAKPRAKASKPGPPLRADDSLKRDLLAWYRRSRRDLPWRRTSDAYLVWLSEVMLQQTTVKTAMPYFEAFAARFPALADLAGAQEEEVLALWSGLGYYHRARNLLRGARHLVDRHEARFPKTLESALAVPGVGLYTASAVLSIAYGVPLPVVDGNVRRVLSRWFALRGPEWRTDAAFYNLADTVLDRKAPGDWNQALMELGATVCSPRKPACPACPVRGHCRAHALGIENELPETRARRAPEDVTVAAALVEQDGRVLLVRRAEGRLLGRMWEVPQTSLESNGHADLVRELKDRLGLDVVAGPLVVRARHAITYRRIRVEGYRARLRRPAPQDPDRFRWTSPAEAKDLPISSMTRKLLDGLAAGQLPLDL